MKNILVTGAKGQLGSSIQELVKGLGLYQFVFTDSETLDITNEKDISNFFKETNFDYCINCAAYTAVDRAEIETELCYKSNAEAVQILAKTCAKHSCILIHISTDFIFDGKKNEPYIETDQPNPLNVYGLSKLKGENYVKEYLDSYFIVRTSWVYSEYGNNFVKTILKLGEQMERLNVISDQYGSPTYAKDLAEFIIALVHKDSKDFGIYHFSNRGNISWYDFAKAIIELSNINTTILPIASKDYKAKALRPKNSVINTDKAQNFLEKPVKNWKQSLAKCIEKL
ncbi:dTDP-4-dehydrorhamnose reductase [Maribacter sp. MJ134]|uniref:dTDP-4-dehydrorhamnose reductase n=1 Tax=Maribacter sp. MJ134 TaxID=2496865 RepID=UPI000F84308B|nr:dTDP-4-dehydrorhamnose reductase [Maribacter sp. MJ134]AZQ59695.1 dTDP-4-dehydrorhamnose reductase [Maribacter sp. MJ134]